MGVEDKLDSKQIDEQLRTLPDWRHSEGALVTVFKLENGRAALDFIAGAGELAEEANHHPDLDWRYNKVFIRLTSHDAGSAVTTRDVAAATSLSQLAIRLGATAQPDKYPA